jgi:hypothetical protein
MSDTSVAVDNHEDVERVETVIRTLGLA